MRFTPAFLHLALTVYLCIFVSNTQGDEVIMEQINASVVSNEPLTGEYWLLQVDAPSISAALEPGQFVNIRVSGEHGPFLRRPFSVYRVSSDRTRLQVAYKLVGEGCRLMRDTLRLEQPAI